MGRYLTEPNYQKHPYLFAIAENDIPNHYAVRKFGHNATVGATEEDIWDGSAVYSYLTAAETLQVSSDDVDDQGLLVSSGAVGEGSTSGYLYDNTANFLADGVAVGDIVLDDCGCFGFVEAVDEKSITTSLERPVFGLGQNYQVVNANDTGAAVVEIQGLDGDWAPQKEFVIMATGASVETVSSFLRIFRARVIHAGSSLGNEGTISINDNADVVNLAQIIPEHAQTLMALWTVPHGHTAYITSFYAATSSSKEVEVDLFVRQYGSVFQVKKKISINQGTTRLPFDLPLPVLERSDITIRASASGGGGDVSAGFDLWYELND